MLTRCHEAAEVTRMHAAAMSHSESEISRLREDLTHIAQQAQQSSQRELQMKQIEFDLNQEIGSHRLIAVAEQRLSQQETAVRSMFEREQQQTNELRRELIEAQQTKTTSHQNGQEYTCHCLSDDLLAAAAQMKRIFPFVLLLRYGKILSEYTLYVP